ncbi:MAG TPA: hypothetical protein VJ975_08840 [Candidatus Limnocylindria bacterium]|nr:hypothetical protein [Candidatus Limnocylindria bacterium]
MVIAAFVSFGLLLAAWVLAPEGRHEQLRSVDVQPEAQLLAA